MGVAGTFNKLQERPPTHTPAPSATPFLPPDPIKGIDSIDSMKEKALQSLKPFPPEPPPLGLAMRHFRLSPPCQAHCSTACGTSSQVHI